MNTILKNTFKHTASILLIVYSLSTVAFAQTTFTWRVFKGADVDIPAGRLVGGEVRMTIYQIIDYFELPAAPDMPPNQQRMGENADAFLAKTWGPWRERCTSAVQAGEFTKYGGIFQKDPAIISGICQEVYDNAATEARTFGQIRWEIRKD